MEATTIELVKQQEVERQARLNEVGTEPPCPFCQRARVARTTYIRCMRCGVNWMHGEQIDQDPRIERYAQNLQLIRSTQAGRSSGAAGVRSTTE